VSKFAYGDGSFPSVFAKEKEKFRVDRTRYIRLLEALDAKAVVSLRPRRMGKTLWKDTLAHYYDVAYKSQFGELFGHLDIGKEATSLANTFHVLPLTFTGLNTGTYDEFKRSFNNALNVAASDFKERYKRNKLSFALNEQDALATFQALVNEIKRKKKQVPKP
jgi:hypothetical protein